MKKMISFAAVLLLFAFFLPSFFAAPVKAETPLKAEGSASLASPAIAAAPVKAAKAEILVPCLLSQPFLHAMNAFEAKFPGENVIFMRIKKMGELSDYIEKGDPRPVIFHGDLELVKLEEDGKLEKGNRQYLFYMDTPLALLVRTELKDKVKSIGDLIIPEIKKIGFPSPQVHSLGDRVEQIIRREGLYEALKDKIVYIPPDKMIIQYISDPKAEIQVEASIVYSDCILSNMTSGNMPKGIEVVQKWSPGFFKPLPVYLVNAARAVEPAGKFLKFIQSPDIVPIFAEHGYNVTLPDVLKEPTAAECPPCDLKPVGKGDEALMPPEKKFSQYFDLENQPLYPIVAGPSGTFAGATIEVLGLLPPTGCKNDLICGLIELPEKYPGVRVTLLDMFSREGRSIMKKRDINCSTIFINDVYEFDVPAAAAERICLKGGPAMFSIGDVVRALESLVGPK